MLKWHENNSVGQLRSENVIHELVVLIPPEWTSQFLADLSLWLGLRVPPVDVKIENHAPINKCLYTNRLSAIEFQLPKFRLNMMNLI